MLSPYLHLTDEKSEAQRAKMIVSRVLSLSQSLTPTLGTEPTSTGAGLWKLFLDRTFPPLSLLIGTSNEHMTQGEPIKFFHLEI